MSVAGYLLPPAADIVIGPLACAVVSYFISTCAPTLPLHPVKRYRAIKNIRRLLKVGLSWLSEDDKEARWRQIQDDWFWADGLTAEVDQLRLHNGLTVRLPPLFLLFCHTFCCRPPHLLYYFMERVATEVETADNEGPAFQLLVQCRGLRYPVRNN